MKTKSILCTIALLGIAMSLWSQTLWHHPDTLIALPRTDSVVCSDEYSVVAVFKSYDPDSVQFLWGIAENDTLQSAFLTNAYFSPQGGIYPSPRVRDYSHWSICYYHTGLKLDTTKSHALWIGSMALAGQPIVQKIDENPVPVAFRELVYVPGQMSRLEAGSWQSYMAMKHGITLDYASYVSSAGDTLWHHEADADYYHRIVAVGSDSTHEWSANSSVSLEDATLAIQVADQLGEGEYLLLGDNGLDETFSMSLDGYDCLSRTWRLRSHTLGNYACSLVWTPAVSIPVPDSVWLDVLDSLDNVVYALSPDSIVGDTSLFFTLPSLQSVQMLSIRTIRLSEIESSRAEAIYNASSGTISLPMLDPDKVYSYALYTHLGHLLLWPAPSRPDCIQVGGLPMGIYRIEAFENNQMAVSVPIIVH